MRIVTSQGSCPRLMTLLVVLSEALFDAVVLRIPIIILLPVFEIFSILRDRGWMPISIRCRLRWGFRHMALREERTAAVPVMDA